MKKEKESLRTVLSGLIIGSTMIVPGVSGGSMAMILGIYDRLIYGVSHVRKEKKQLVFLLLFSVSAGAGMLLFAGPLLWLLEHDPMPVSFFFLGAVLGAVPMIVRKSGRKLWDIDSLIWILAGVLGVMLLALVPEGVFRLENGKNPGYALYLILAGIPAASAAVLPGISVSHFLLILGLYEGLMNSIRTLQLGFLVPLGIGVVLGLALTVKGLEYVLREYPAQTYLVILGFILGSVGELFPGIPATDQIFGCVICGTAGFLLLSRLAGREG